METPEQFACERGHRLHKAELARSVEARVTMAFWLAIEALETEAATLRLLAAVDGDNEELAEQAADDARLLRKMASAHLTPLGRTPPSSP
jgi:hypothetical protein